METKKTPISEVIKRESRKKFLKVLEIYSVILLMAYFIVIITGNINIGISRVLESCTLSFLALYCYLIGWSNFVSESKFLTYWFYKIHGFGLSIGFITILFFRFHWPLPKDITTILSAVLIFISLLLGIREKSGENINHIDWKYFLRILVGLTPIIYLIIQQFK
jgi:hypothetical protein